MMKNADIPTFNQAFICLLFTCLLVLFWSSPIRAQTQLKQKLSQAITKLEQTKRSEWGYQVTRYENEEGDITSSIEGFNPASDEQSKERNQWTLIQKNGHPPTIKQEKRFKEKKLKQAKNKEKGKGFSLKLREIINENSFKLMSENSQSINVSFDVFISRLGDDSIGKLQGNLIYNKQLEYIETITIENNEDFSPIFSANISDFKLTLTFININNSILPRQNEMEMKGTFAFFTEINEVSNDIYSNYVNKMNN